MGVNNQLTCRRIVEEIAKLNVYAQDTGAEASQIKTYEEG